jgi:uncharacterized membrane protein
VSGMNSELASAVAVGAVSGMRTFLVPALVSHAAGRDRRGSPFRSHSPRWMRSPAVIRTLTIAAVGEMIGDKLPFTPDRTVPPSLAARAVSGALTAATLASWDRRPAVPAVLLAAAGAIASAHLMIRLRRSASRQLPDPLVAIAEDFLALRLGYSLARSAHTRSDCYGTRY